MFFTGEVDSWIKGEDRENLMTSFKLGFEKDTNSTRVGPQGRKRVVENIFTRSVVGALQFARPRRSWKFIPKLEVRSLGAVLLEPLIMPGLFLTGGFRTFHPNIHKLLEVIFAWRNRVGVALRVHRFITQCAQVHRWVRFNKHFHRG